MRKYKSTIMVFLVAISIGTVMAGRNLVSRGDGFHAGQAVPQGTAQTVQRTPAQQNWEYRVVQSYGNHQGLEADLNRLGSQGYEVFSVNQTQAGDYRANPNSSQFVLTILLRRLKY
jgi:hypothetical protein